MQMLKKKGKKKKKEIIDAELASVPQCRIESWRQSFG